MRVLESRPRALIAAAVSSVVLVLALVVLISDASGTSSSESRMDLRDEIMARSTKVTIPPSEDPGSGIMFGKLIMLAFDCLIELKRALKGHRLDPDYDANAKVEYVETMLMHLVRELNIDEMPPPKLKGRRASFLVAVKKVQLLHQLVKDIPLLEVVDTMRASRYGEIKFNIEQISHALDTVVAQLEIREFAALEPKDSAIDHALTRIKRSKIDTDSPVFHTPSWDDVNNDITKHLFAGSVQGHSPAGGIDDGLHPKITVWDDDADGSNSGSDSNNNNNDNNNNNGNNDDDSSNNSDRRRGQAREHLSRKKQEEMQRAVDKAQVHKVRNGGNYIFDGTMDALGNLVGELIPAKKK